MYLKIRPEDVEIGDQIDEFLVLRKTIQFHPFYNVILELGTEIDKGRYRADHERQYSPFHLPWDEVLIRRAKKIPSNWMELVTMIKS